MTREELLNQLELLLPSQFEAVVFRAGIPTGYLPGVTASQMERAIAVIRYIEQQNQLDELARIVQRVVTGGGTAGRGPSVTPSTSPQRARIDFTAERARHGRFIGRTALLAQLDELLIDEEALMLASGSIRDPFPAELEEVAARYFQLFPPTTKA